MSFISFEVVPTLLQPKLSSALVCVLIYCDFALAFVYLLRMPVFFHILLSNLLFVQILTISRCLTQSAAQCTNIPDDGAAIVVPFLSISCSFINLLEHFSSCHWIKSKKNFKANKPQNQFSSHQVNQRNTPQ